VILAACVAISQGYTFSHMEKMGIASLTDSEKLALISDRELQVTEVSWQRKYESANF
jgi:two-component system response regulator FimZ (fimbrial Z protein)/two-component system response regulator EvgA